jgi:hypothetical protein
MFAKAIAALALAAPLVSAQTFTKCNPLTASKPHHFIQQLGTLDLHSIACPADPAFGRDTVHCDFTKGACEAFAEDAGTTLEHNENGAVFTISGPNQAPTIATGKYIFFGRVDVEVQASTGVGICTSAVLQSDDLDEVSSPSPCRKHLLTTSD